MQKYWKVWLALALVFLVAGCISLMLYFNRDQLFGTKINDLDGNPANRSVEVDNSGLVKPIPENITGKATSASLLFTDSIFPNLELKHDGSWTIRVEKTPDENYNKLSKFKVSFSKDKSKYIVNLLPVYGSGCSGASGPEPTVLKNGIKKYVLDFEVFYSNSYSSCENYIQTNLLVTSIPDLNKNLYNVQKEFVTYRFSINRVNKTEPLLAEIEEMIASSVFK